MQEYGIGNGGKTKKKQKFYNNIRLYAEERKKALF